MIFSLYYLRRQQSYSIMSIQFLHFFFHFLCSHVLVEMAFMCTETRNIAIIHSEVHITDKILEDCIFLAGTGNEILNSRTWEWHQQLLWSWVLLKFKYKKNKHQSLGLLLCTCNSWVQSKHRKKIKATILSKIPNSETDEWKREKKDHLLNIYFSHLSSLWISCWQDNWYQNVKIPERWLSGHEERKGLYFIISSLEIQETLRCREGKDEEGLTKNQLSAILTTFLKITKSSWD